MIAIFTALVLGFLMILDPCTLFTSIAAISYIDREMQNKRRVFVTGIMFVLGKLVTYVLLSIPFIVGAQTEHIHHLLEQWGEPMLCVFMLLCGILLLVVGHHHHNHDHGMNKWLQTVDDKSSWFWAFMLGIFFAIAFCPHRLIYFFTMVDTAIMNWILPIVFGLGTGLPILILAWVICYSAVNTQVLTTKVKNFEKWFRYICAVLFLGYGIYLGAHLLCEDEHRHHHHESTATMVEQHVE